ncbi:hypothetical protein [Pseudoalteromonas sp. T1lg21]|uniref:hypothetical protein n=1 Tax=Pseudoalteromonas sp. T1lg21 TaxID=2077095 RepID=UPI000CF6DF67|nr:hypothetical protein [Pseudoalteromonas sp. T1lg21]
MSYLLEHMLALEDRQPLPFYQHVGYSMLFAIPPLLLGAPCSVGLYHFKKTRKLLLWEVVWGLYVTMFLALGLLFLGVYLFY